MMENPKEEALNHIAPFIDLEELQRIAKSAAIISICDGNAHQAKTLRTLYINNLGKIICNINGTNPEGIENLNLSTKRGFEL